LGAALRVTLSYGLFAGPQEWRGRKVRALFFLVNQQNEQEENMSGKRSEGKTWGTVFIVVGVICLCCGLLPVAVPFIGLGLNQLFWVR
jgi:hypothetical protein